jgi:regulatory protein
LELSKKDLIAKMENYCAYMERCTNDVILKMKKLGIEDQLFEDVIDYLKENQFLSDDRYVESYIRGKAIRKRDGHLKIINALRQKKIDAKLIESKLDIIEKEQIEENIEYLIEKKWKLLIPKNDYYKSKEKLVRYLMSKGYCFEQFKNKLPKK